MRELERRFPEPSLLPKGYECIAWGSAMWTDRPFFQNTVNLVFGALADKVPASFIADREKLRGAKFDVAAMTAAIPQMRDQFRAHLRWIDVQLGDERTWLAGGDAEPRRHQRLYERLVPALQPPPTPRAARRVRPCPRLGRAAARGGHGQRTEMSTAEALESRPARRRRPPSSMIPTIRTAARWATRSRSRPTITARSAWPARSSRSRPSTSPSAGTIRSAGEVVVHFPRAGFLVLPA